MAYRVDAIVGKIESPVVLRLGDETMRFASGEFAAAAELDRRTSIGSVRLSDDAVEVHLVELPTVDMSWVGEEPVSFF